MNRNHCVRTGAAAVIAALLVLTGCSSGSGAASLTAASSPATTASATATAPALPSPTPQGTMPVVATPKPRLWPDVKVTINAVERGAGGLLTVVFTVTNHGQADFDLQGKFRPSPYNYIGGGTEAVTIVDHTAKQRYYTLVNDGVTCECYRGTDSNNNGNVPAGGSQTVYDVYRPDTMPTTVDVEIPGYAPAKDVPVTG